MVAAACPEVVASPVAGDVAGHPTSQVAGEVVGGDARSNEEARAAVEVDDDDHPNKEVLTGNDGYDGTNRHHNSRHQ